MEKVEINKDEKACTCGNKLNDWSVDEPAFLCPICGTLICGNCCMYFTHEIARKKTPEGKMDKYPFGLPVPYKRPQKMIDHMNEAGWDLFVPTYQWGMHLCAECGTNEELIIKMFYKLLKKHTKQRDSVQDLNFLRK